GVAAGAEVGAGQAAPAEHGPVRAAARGRGHGLEPRGAHGVQREVYEPAVLRQELLGHVAVGERNVHGDRALAVLGVYLRRGVEQGPLSAPEVFKVEVAQDIAELRLAAAAAYVREVVEALAARALARRLIRGQACGEAAGELGGVYH